VVTLARGRQHPPREWNDARRKDLELIEDLATARTAETAAETLHWVFGYGSLIWQPGFDFVIRERALLRGAHRSLCIYSHIYRGTEAAPGLVFGLARGGACGGMAFGVAAAVGPVVIASLRARELVTDVYREAVRPVRLAGGRTVAAVAYLADEHHPQYAGGLGLAEQAGLVRRSVGQSGPNLDYVLNTAEHLRQLGIHDRPMDRLATTLPQPPGSVA
jgi:cation transport protein ChaC